MDNHQQDQPQRNSDNHQQDRPRRNSDNTPANMQYWTERGSVPMAVVKEQVRAISDPRDAPPNRYPAVYRNQEAHGQNFQPHEVPPGTTFYEVPVATRLDEDRRPATLQQVQDAKNPRPNDRARVVKRPPNDPGPFRGVTPVDVKLNQVYPAAGLIYHPEGHPAGFSRAPIEPMDREGRQFMNRVADDTRNVHRVTTWPARDENASDLTTYEERYQRTKRRGHGSRRHRDSGKNKKQQ